MEIPKRKFVKCNISSLHPQNVCRFFNGFLIVLLMYQIPNANKVRKIHAPFIAASMSFHFHYLVFASLVILLQLTCSGLIRILIEFKKNTCNDTRSNNKNSQFYRPNRYKEVNVFAWLASLSITGLPDMLVLFLKKKFILKALHYTGILR